MVRDNTELEVRKALKTQKGFKFRLALNQKHEYSMSVLSFEDWVHIR